MPNQNKTTKKGLGVKTIKIANQVLFCDNFGLYLDIFYRIHGNVTLGNS